MDVALARWPAERARVEDLRARRLPRLLLLDAEEPPQPPDCLEDWVRAPAPTAEVEARLAGLRLRSGWHGVRPHFDADGLLRFRDGWVSLSPVERRLAGALVDRFGAVVTRDALTERAWPEGAPTRNALDVHVLRLRRRIAPLALEVRTVRACGYLLQVPTGRPGPTLR